MCCLPIVGKKHNKRHNLKDVLVIIKKKCLKILLIKKNVLKYGAMAKIGCTRKPDGQNRVPRSTLVPGRHFIGQRPPRPDSGRISNGSTRFWLLIPPWATRFQSHLPDYGRATCTLVIFLRAKKIRQLKNYDTLRFILDVESFRGGIRVFAKVRF